MTMQNQSYLEKTDEELLGLCAAGETEAFGELACRYEAMAFHAARFILRNEAEAEEEVQESLAKAYEHLPRFRRNAKFSTWLVRIVVNQCLMRLRSFRRANLVSLEALNFEKPNVTFNSQQKRESPETELQAAEMAEILRREIGRIPPLLRNAFVLRHVEQKPMKDVAQALGISVHAAKSRLLRARIELQARLSRSLCYSGPELLDQTQ